MALIPATTGVSRLTSRRLGVDVHLPAAVLLYFHLTPLSPARIRLLSARYISFRQVEILHVPAQNVAIRRYSREPHRPDVPRGLSWQEQARARSRSRYQPRKGARGSAHANYGHESERESKCSRYSEAVWLVLRPPIDLYGPDGQTSTVLLACTRRRPPRSINIPQVPMRTSPSWNS
jgi:hypothetical protein